MCGCHDDTLARCDRHAPRAIMWHCAAATTVPRWSEATEKLPRWWTPPESQNRVQPRTESNEGIHLPSDALSYLTRRRDELQAWQTYSSPFVWRQTIPVPLPGPTWPAFPFGKVVLTTLPLAGQIQRHHGRRNARYLFLPLKYNPFALSAFSLLANTWQFPAKPVWLPYRVDTWVNMADRTKRTQFAVERWIGIVQPS